MTEEKIKDLNDLKGKIKPLQIIIAVVIIGAALYFSWGGFRTVSEPYKSWEKTEASVDSVWSNGIIGKGQSDVWLISYSDKQGEKFKKETLQTTSWGKNMGDKVTIYYDPADPKNCLGEDAFNEVKYR